MSLSVTIEAKHYVVTEAQVEALAVQVHEGKLLTSTYLRALVVATQGALGKGRRVPDVTSQVAAVDATHEQFYGWVRRGLEKAAGTELVPAEVNRRGTFARVAASALRLYAAEGGDIRKLVAAEVKRRDLRPDKAVAIPDGASRDEATVIRATAVIARAADRLVEADDAAAARALIEDAIAALQVRLAALQPEAKVARTTVGAATFRYPPNAKAARPARAAA